MDLDPIETRLTVLERRVDRYRKALVVIFVALASVVLLGATTDDVSEVVKTRELWVFNDAGSWTEFDLLGRLQQHIEPVRAYWCGC